MPIFFKFYINNTDYLYVVADKLHCLSAVYGVADF